MKKYLLTAALLTMVSTKALAWGAFEQGVVSGVAGYWIFDKLNRAAQPAPIYPAGVQLQQRPVQPVPAPPQYGAPPPPTTWFYRYPECRTEYLYNNIGVAVATQSICN